MWSQSGFLSQNIFKHIEKDFGYHQINVFGKLLKLDFLNLRKNVFLDKSYTINTFDIKESQLHFQKLLLGLNLNPWDVFGEIFLIIQMKVLLNESFGRVIKRHILKKFSPSDESLLKQNILFFLLPNLSNGSILITFDDYLIIISILEHQ